jgi:short-subunit dehydrogenase
MPIEIVLITGASSGIGRELARCFARDGSRLVLVSRKRKELQSLADELHAAHKAHCEVVTADLAERDAPARLFKYLESGGTKVDVLVNNAGFGAYGHFAELSLERQLDMIQVNVTSLAHLTRLFLPGMISRRRGGVLNVASTASFQAGPGMAVYYATKAFVLSLTEAIAEEVRPYGLRVSALCPGPTATNFGAFRSGKVVKIAGLRNAVLALAAKLCPRALVRKVAGKFNAASYTGPAE